jgi:elongation factor G
MSPGDGYEFVDKIVGGKIPEGVHPSIDLGHPGGDGVGRARRVPRRRRPHRAVDGSYHDVDSSEIAFKVAGSMAFKER